MSHAPDPWPAHQFEGPYTRLHMEAGLCIWEDMNAIMDGGRSDYAPELDPDWFAAFKAAWENHGSSAMRQHAIDLADPALKLWDALSDDEQEDFGSYDWEFIPWFVSQTSWKEGNEIVLLPERLLAAAREELVVRRARNTVINGRSHA